jgi:hypothetical protein
MTGYVMDERISIHGKDGTIFIYLHHCVQNSRVHRAASPIATDALSPRIKLPVSAQS